MNKRFSFKRSQSFSADSIKSLLLLAGLIFSPLAQAKIHIEPYAGWSWTFTNSNPIKQDTVEGVTSTVKYLDGGRHYTGPSAGMRIGYSSLGLAVGVDFTVGRWTSFYKEGFKEFRGKENITALLPGLFVSYKLPLLFRAYASLLPHSPVHFTNEEGYSRSCKQSRGMKLGLSYLSLPFISVNFEYMPLYIGGQDCGSWSHTGSAYVNFIF